MVDFPLVLGMTRLRFPPPFLPGLSDWQLLVLAIGRVGDSVVPARGRWLYIFPGSCLALRVYAALRKLFEKQT